MMKAFMVGLILFAAFGRSLHADTSDETATLKGALKKEIPEVEVDAIRRTPIAGLLEVVIGAKVFYFTPDARYMIDGDLINLSSRENLTEATRSGVRVRAIEELGEKKMVVFEPATRPAKHKITVVTDVTCPYCVKLHREIGLLTKGGAKVQYLLYPRAGLGSPAHKTMVSVWCAEDRPAALTKAKFGEPITEKECNNPIEEHIVLAHSLGLQGTPMIILDDGRLVPGYRPAKELLQLLQADR